MFIKTPKQLPEDLEIRCYACDEMVATHLCQYQIEALAVQVCLCDACLEIDPHRLLENIVGIQGLSGPAVTHAASNFAPSKKKWAVGG